jgi:AraC-like DNA-binding protein
VDPAVRQRIREKIEAALADEAIICDSLLSLQTLSRAVREDPRYVSQVINLDLGANFYDLISRHRIELAKARLVKSPEETVLAIALAVGFNSKSTFNAAFRRFTGLTPREFRNRPLGDAPDSPRWYGRESPA